MNDTAPPAAPMSSPAGSGRHGPFDDMRTSATAMPLTADRGRGRLTTRQFLGKFWRFLVAIKDGLALLFLLLFFALLFGAMAGKPTGGWVPSGGALTVKLDGILTEQPTEPELGAVLQGQKPIPEFRRRDIVHALETAATDSRVKAVVLDLDSFMGGGQVALGDVAQAIDKVRAAKKPVLAYATGYSNDAYQLAAHASEIWTPELGGVMVTAPGNNQLFMKSLLDKLGIEARVYRVGTFKAAVEPLIRTDMSPESKQANLAYMTALWGQWQEQVKRARPKANLDPIVQKPADTIVAAGGLSAANLKDGLVDKLGNRVDFDKRVAEITGALDKHQPWKYTSISLRNWIASNPPSESGTPIAVVPIVGSIIDGRAGPGTAGGETIARNILDAVADKNIKAIVLRVDSGGGSVLASERIRSAVLQAKARKLPVVASFGNVAASGGYWVAMNADKVYAEPDTVTGSIGVFGVIPNFSRAAEKIGVNADGIGMSPLANEPNVLDGMSPEFDRVAQQSVDDIYARFTGGVAAGRAIPIEKVREIAEGRVWAGADARQFGLVSAFGGLDDAVAEAARLAKLDPTSVYPRYFEAPMSTVGEILASMGRGDEDEVDAPQTDLFAHAAWQRDQQLAAMMHSIKLMTETAGVQASCVECAAYMPPAPVDAGAKGWFARLAAMLN